MKKNIRYISELPECFHYSKYVNASSLDALGWYIQFTIRRNYFLTKHLWEKSGLPECPDMKKIYIKLLELIMKNPIIDKNEVPEIFYGKKDYIPPSDLPSQTLGIRAMTPREFIQIQQQLSPDKWEHLMANAENLSFAWLFPDSSNSESWVDEPLYNSCTPTLVLTAEKAICVNLELPDDILTKHFEQFLHTLREETKTTRSAKQLKKHDFDNWQYFGVLLYIDLKIWALESNTKISNRILADVIFPQGEGGEEAIRKTTQPLVNWLLGDTSLAILAANALTKIPEKNMA